MIYRNYEIKVARCARYGRPWLAKVFPIPSIGKSINPSPGFSANTWRKSADKAKAWLDCRCGGSSWPPGKYEETLSLEEIALIEKTDPMYLHMKTLDVTEPLSRKKIEVAFKCQAKKLHPDVGGDAKEFHNLMISRNYLFTLYEKSK